MPMTSMDLSYENNTLREEKTTRWKESVILSAHMEQSYPEVRGKLISIYFSDYVLGLSFHSNYDTVSCLKLKS